MGITSKTPKNYIEAYINKALQKREVVILRNLSYLGEMCVNHARDLDPPKSFNDYTANLRASIGYILLNDGKIVSESGFEKVDGKGEEGSVTGKDFARKLIADYGKGYVLIVVAGMNYASYVEAKGKDVITSAELLANKKMPGMLKKLGLQ